LGPFLQTDVNPDPFTLMIGYYGYDHYQVVTTYLGYFIVSIGQAAKQYVSDANNYWNLKINGKISEDGMDSVLIEPNTKVHLKWLSAGAVDQKTTARL
jgi:hypothetical protein